ncbi:MAG: F0F1 ATP synthase subunit B [Erysipelotrichaceae bacterium]|nr:F0F1 ATP synthase subunit B [Erysipelotrichaceae bacterium]
MIYEDTGITLPTSDDFVSKLIPNWISFVAQLAALLVLIAVVIFFAYKPVKKIITQRQEYIENNIKQSEADKLIAAQNAKQSEEMVIASQKKADQLVEDARKASLDERNRMVDETNQLIAKMKDDAQKDIEQATLDAKDAIRKEMIDLALSASSEILKREVNEKDNARIAEDFIRSIED